MKKILFGLFFLFSLFKLEGQTNFYVDANWTGTQVGTAAEPWGTNLTSTFWKSVLTALSNEPVNIYFNSLQRSNNLSIGLNGQNSNAFGLHLLVLDGMSYYNANETSPTWIANPTNYSYLTNAAYTSNCAYVRFITAEDSNHQLRSDVTIHGFTVVGPSTKAIAIAGNNWIVEYCNASSVNNATSGPCILLCPTSDGPHAGSVAFTVPMTNVVIRYNYVHDTFGEAIYVGGGGFYFSAAQWLALSGTNKTGPGNGIPQPGSGYPANSYIWIQSNTVFKTSYSSPYVGSGHGQGDGTDIKGGIAFLTVEGNEYFTLTDPQNVGIRAIVNEGMPPDTTYPYSSFSEGNLVTSMEITNAWLPIVGETVSGIGIPSGITVTSITQGTNIGLTPFIAIANSSGFYTFSQIRIIRNNYIHDCIGLSDGCIVCNDGWGIPQGVSIYNNVMMNITGFGFYGTNKDVPTGIKITTSQDPVLIYNNTIYYCTNNAISTVFSACSLLISNNFFISNNLDYTKFDNVAGELNFKTGTTVSSDYNWYSGTIGNATEGNHSQITTASVNFINPGFNLNLLITSPARNMGVNLSSLFNFDIYYNPRPSVGNWDIGAYQFILPTTNLLYLYINY